MTTDETSPMRPWEDGHTFRRERLSIFQASFWISIDLSASDCEAGLYIIEKSKGLEMGKEIKEGKTRKKKENLGKK